ncbi:NAD-dependent deacetylase sirtuin-2 [Ascobolus immersus RN42]|uniref:NAD-dependent deacetylase sirtuin-2 n=1 Tax=Ascobolus immersus RN42 TaxID=1160509 RepID=A0A3N4IY08_ASCIM|nr:NAD-dependent deacetylase sirtuin-2 [Ascobolus immersus RN42]
MGNELSSTKVPGDVPPQTLESRTLAGLASYIKSRGGPSNVSTVFLVGAGISTAAGIPDFRSPETGLYSQLERLDLPYPEAVFEISFFREKPEAFYALRHELDPDRYEPTISHAFMKLWEEKGGLRKVFTQNIDTLERKAGISPSKIVEAHGSFASQRCIDCKTPMEDIEFKKVVDQQGIPHCLTPNCNGLVKPDIVFFGEALPSSFFDELGAVGEADLAIIMGTSLSVHPFAGLPTSVQEEKPRVLINMEEVGDIGSRRDDVLVLGDCDTGCKKFAKELGWLEELEDLWFSLVSEKTKQKYLERKEQDRKDAEQRERILGDHKIAFYDDDEDVGHVKTREEVDNDVRDEVEKMVHDVEEALNKVERLKKRVDDEGLGKSETDKQVDALTEEVKKVEIKDDEDKKAEEKKVEAVVGSVPSL